MYRVRSPIQAAEDEKRTRQGTLSDLSFTLGIDILDRPDRRRHAVLEVNVFDQGEDTYTATLSTWQRQREGGDAMNLNEVVGRDDLLLMTFDTLRYDVAREAWRAGETPNLSRRLPAGGWERRHTPGNFTYAAHAAFFAGFLPTPAQPGRHPRPFALRFPGSETITADTCVFDADNLVTGLARRGYHTICIGGVGFFNKQSPLGNVFPALFAESHWSPALGVTDPESAANQVRLAVECLARVPSSRRVFLFVNLSALHQPNYFYLPGATEDSRDSQRAALGYVDRQLPPLFDALERRASGFAILCSDHGTAYGEDGYHGHRLAHSAVWDVPYAEYHWERRP